jgi:hypothetical protein
MAAVSRAVVCQDGDNRMTNETDHSLTPTAKQPRRPPVRLKLRRVNANLAKAYPPDGESKVWWKRLKKALGTMSSDFVNASLLQLQAAAQLPCGGISETATNAALALIEAAEPRNEIEGVLAVQMACTHAAAMSVLARFRGGGGSERRVVALATAAARLMRAYSVQVEALRRLRHGGDQYVRVEHVHVNDGGQAVIGNVKTAGSVGPAQGPALTAHANDPVSSSAAYGRGTLEHTALTAPPASGPGPPERGITEVTTLKDKDP